MVKLLSALQRRINSLLQEREDHPGLQKLSDILQMLLNIPSSTPLAKVIYIVKSVIKDTVSVKKKATVWY